MKMIVTASLLGSALAIFVGGGESYSSESPGEHSLKSGRQVGTTDRVQATLEVGGTWTLGTAGQQAQSTKVRIVSRVAYHEKALELPAAPSGRLRVARHYDQADAVIEADETLKPVLRPDRRLIGLEAGVAKGVLYSPCGPLTREELNLLDLPGSQLALDRLLPNTPVAVQATWAHSPEDMAALLGLDAVTRADVHSQLTEITETAARFELDGSVEGVQSGALLTMELKGRYRFDRRCQRVDWLGMLIKEKAKPSAVMPGADVVSRLQMQISPTTGPTPLEDEANQALAWQATPELTQLLFEPKGMQWRLTYDRDWFVRAENSDSVVFRLMDDKDMVAQCNISLLAKSAAGTQVPLEQYQKDVQKALDKNFGEFLDASQWGNSVNYQIYRVAVRGAVSDVPIEWHYYLVAEEHGRQVAMAVTVNERLVEKLGKADHKLADAIRFLEPKIAAKQAPQE